MANLAIYGRPSTGGLIAARSGDTLVGSSISSHTGSSLILNADSTSILLKIGGNTYLTVTSSSIGATAGTAFTGDGSGLTGIQDTALSSNVMKLSGAQTVTGQKTFPGAGSNAIVLPAVRSTSGGNDITVPTASGADSFLLLNQAQAPTNKTIDAANNTVLGVRAGSIQGGSTSSIAAANNYFCVGIGGTAATGDRALFFATSNITVKNFSFLAAISTGAVTFTVRFYNGSAWVDSTITGTVTSPAFLATDTTHTLNLTAGQGIGVKFTTNGSVTTAVTEIQINGEWVTR